MTEEKRKEPVANNLEDEEDIDDDFDDEDNDDLDEEDIEDEDEDNEESDDEEEEDDVAKDGKDGKKSKSVQDEAERARYAQARREREAKEKETREKKLQDEAYLKGKLEATKVNSFTNEPIEDEYDLHIYELQKQLEKEGKDPISDLPKRLAEINRSAGNKAKTAEKEKKERDEAIDNDIKDFKSKYPKVNLPELLKDPDFKEYIDGRLGIKGGKSLATIYEDFEKLKSKFSGKKANEEDDGKKSPPSPNGQRHTRTTYSSMSEEDKIKELKKQGLIS